MFLAASYLQLVPMVNQPPRKYPPKDPALDLSYDLAYGCGVWAAYALLER